MNLPRARHTGTVARPVRSAAAWESAVEQQIREAMVRGEFDDLPGRGKPIPGLDGSHDEEWWVKRKLQREQLSYLPPALALRKEVEDARITIGAADSEAAVREIVATINERIVHVNSNITFGPASTLMRLDVEETVRRWRDMRGDQDG